MDYVHEIVDKQNIVAASRLIRGIEDGLPEAYDIVAKLYVRKGRSHIVGITGSPGVGKSSLTFAIAKHLLGRGLRVGALLIDPSSPLTGGALLGDRIRMQELALDPKIYIKSLATRGSTGGLTISAYSILAVFEALGSDVVILETVGAGQDEFDIRSVAHTNLVVLAPNLGDDIQAIKAGIMDIADIFVLNKMDIPGIERLKLEVSELIDLRGTTDGYPVARVTNAHIEAGITELVEAIIGHRVLLGSNGGFEQRYNERAKIELKKIIEARLDELIDRRFATLDESYTVKNPFTLAADFAGHLSGGFDEFFNSKIQLNADDAD